MLVRVCRRSGRSCALAGREPPRQDDDEDTGQDGSNDVRDAVHGLCSRQWENGDQRNERKTRRGDVLRAQQREPFAHRSETQVLLLSFNLLKGTFPSQRALDPIDDAAPI